MTIESDDTLGEALEQCCKGESHECHKMEAQEAQQERITDETGIDVDESEDVETAKKICTECNTKYDWWMLECPECESEYFEEDNQ